MNQIDQIMLDMGIVSIDSLDEEATLKVLLPFCFDILVVGVHISLSDWKSFSPLTQAAFVTAARTMRGMDAPKPEGPSPAVRARVSGTQTPIATAKNEEEVSDILRDNTARVIDKLNND